MQLTAIIKKREKFYVALCPEVDVVSQGKTKDEALENLKEAVELYVEEAGLPDKPVIERFVIPDETAKNVGKASN